MRTALTLLLFIVNSSTFGQSTDSLNPQKATFSNYEQLRIKQKELSIDQLTYLDSTFNFQVKVPGWLTLKETGSAYVWGGTLPAVKGIENAIVIKAFKKADYHSLKDFENYLVEGLKFGHPTRWSQSYLFMGKKPLDDFKKIGDAYKIYLMRGRLLYHCEYILLETPSAYLWIDFTSTAETFAINSKKFDEFMSGFIITNFAFVRKK